MPKTVKPNNWLACSSDLGISSKREKSMLGARNVSTGKD